MTDEHESGTRTTPGRHEHVAVARRVVILRGGVPYEVERSTCAICGQVLAEHALRRALA